MQNNMRRFGMQRAIEGWRKFVVVGAVTAAAVLAMVTPASASVILWDDFNAASTGDLTGQTAISGQMWAVGPYPDSAQVGTAFGAGGTQGAGQTVSTSGVIVDFGNTILLGQTFTSGTISVQVDRTISSVASWYTDTYVNLVDTVNATSANLDFGNGAAPGRPLIALEGLALWTQGGGGTYNNVIATGTLHTSLDFDLDARTVSYSWYDVSDPSNPLTSGTSAVIPYGVGLDNVGWTFNPNALTITATSAWVTDTFTVTSGLDNIFVTHVPVPEPGTMALAIMGLAGLLLRRKNRGN